MPAARFSRMEGNYSAGADLTPANGSRPWITPNRREINNRFPSLGFTVDTGGLPYFEVLLATDRTLFDRANAGLRSAGNFYASRQDSGLISVTAAGAIYLVPPAVLRGFAQSQPAPTALFYTLIAYQGRQGTGPQFAHSPETLPGAAPFVAIAPGFRGKTLSDILSIPEGKLKTYYGSGRPSAGLTLDVDSDAAEGEDGCSVGSGADGAAAQQWPSSATADPEGDEGPQDGYEANYAGTLPALPSPVTSEAPAAGGMAAAAPIDRVPVNGARRGSEGPAVAYSDGYGPMSEESPPMPVSQGGHAPLDFREPPELFDEDDYGESYGDAAEHSDIGERVGAAPAYGDEADAWDGDLPAFRALDAAGSASPAAQPLSIEAKLRIIEQIARCESGADGYAAVRTGAEFHDPHHPAFQRYHAGLSYGILGFSQGSGALGQLLSMMRDRDTPTFARIFGPASEELIRVTNAPGPASRDLPGGRSARVQPIEGSDLWEEPWLSRFRQAGGHVPFQAAQNQLAAATFIDPMLRFAGWLGLDTDRALSLAIDCAVRMGVDQAQAWIIEAVGPVQTAAQRQRVLTALGHPELHAFQSATPELDADGLWGPRTHAAMVAALRRLGSASPVPIPTREQMMDAMVRSAAGTPAAAPVQGLRHSGGFEDILYQF